jgi:hypothetical protein
VQEANYLRANADLQTKSPPEVLALLEKEAVKIIDTPAEELTRSDLKLMELRLDLEADLRPDQLRDKVVVKAAVSDALWYAEAPADLAWKDKVQVLTNAIKLSQKKATTDSSHVDASADQEARCLQKIIKVKYPTKYDYQKHLEIVKICVDTLKEANNTDTAGIHQKLRHVTREYLQMALDAAKKADPRRGKPEQVAKEIKAFEDLLKSVPQ